MTNFKLNFSFNEYVLTATLQFAKIKEQINQRQISKFILNYRYIIHDSASFPKAHY